MSTKRETVTYEVDYLNMDDKFRTKLVTIDAPNPALSLTDELLQRVRLQDPKAKRIWHYTERKAAARV